MAEANRLIQDNGFCTDTKGDILDLMEEAVNKVATEKSLTNRLLRITDPMEDLCNEQLMADVQSVMDDLWREEKARTMVHGEGTVDEMMEFLFYGTKPGRARLPTQGTQALA